MGRAQSLNPYKNEPWLAMSRRTAHLKRCDPALQAPALQGSCWTAMGFPTTVTSRVRPGKMDGTANIGELIRHSLGVH